MKNLLKCVSLSIASSCRSSLLLIAGGLMLLLLPPDRAQAQNHQIGQLSFDQHQFWKASHDGNSALLIFLHGGVNNPAFEEPSFQIEPDFLLEGNTPFIDSCIANGYDVILPVKDDALNWLDSPETCYQSLMSFLDSREKDYAEIVIAGFSDGGTGAYKIFYAHPEKFNGLLVFNGYPQHRNYNLNVDYSVVSGQKIVFISTTDDKVIPYEFLLTEYCKQKSGNPDTYIYVASGGHSFGSYSSDDLGLIMNILRDANDNSNTDVKHGLVRRDTLAEFYPFRKKILKKFNYGEDCYLENQKQLDIYGKGQ